MTSHRNYSFVSHRPTSSNVDEMQPPEVATKKSSRPSQSKQPTGQKCVEKKERRRQQVLLAQRAYRARNEAHTRALEQRVARLEQALERTGQAVISFTDVLVGARVLGSHQQITHRLRDTVKTCLNSAMYGDDCLEDVAYSNPPETSLIAHTSIVQQTCAEDEREEWPLSNDHAGLSVLSRSPLLPSVPDGATMIEVPVFVDHLRIACLYQGFLLLNNASVPLEALKRPFRLLLSLVTRETITSYFHACLYARLNDKQPDRCSSIPCFRLGGAGTHYPEVIASNQIESGSEQYDPPKIHGALSAFSPEAQKDLDGEWFDLSDLVGFLRAEGTTFSMAPPVEDTAHRTVNAVDFTAALVEKGICLGHSPGFKRSDVEVAIDFSCWK